MFQCLTTYYCHRLVRLHNYQITHRSPSRQLTGRTQTDHDRGQPDLTWTLYVTNTITAVCQRETVLIVHTKINVLTSSLFTFHGLKISLKAYVTGSTNKPVEVREAYEFMRT